MKAVILRAEGDVSQLVIEEIEKPQIQADEIRVKTGAFSINPIEVKTRKGNRFTDKLLQDKPSILGWDASGTIEAVGSEVAHFKPGDRVFGIIGFPHFGKTYAEYFVAKEKDLCPMPTNISFAEAAGSTIAAITAYQALKDFGQLQNGTKVLIHAASGGVGHFGVQLAKHFGAEVTATASGKNRDFVLGMGADHFIDYQQENFEEKAKEMDVVFDLIGGTYIDRSLNCLKEGGILISIPTATNAEVEEKAAARNCKGVRFKMKAEINDLQEIANLLAQEKLQAIISQTFAIDQIRAAHTSLETGHTKGKIAITQF